MSIKLNCRYCDEEFAPSIAKPGYYDVCPRCTAAQLRENPELEPEPLRAGLSTDESGTFEEIAPASKVLSRSAEGLLPRWGNVDEKDSSNKGRRK